MEELDKNDDDLDTHNLDSDEDTESHGRTIRVINP